MSHAIDTLMNEHRVIEKVLSALKNCVRLVQAGGQVERSTVGAFAEFFRNFADRCHHGKEEDRLFTEMIRFGFSREAGPIAVMLDEHDQGRKHVGVLACIGAGTGPLKAEEAKELVAHAAAFTELLAAHIQKEDQILYPMALQAIPSQDMENLSTEFEKFEREVMGEDTHATYHRLAEELSAKFSPGN